MKRLQFLIGIAIGLSHSWSIAADHSARPNVIIILADDLGYGDLGCYGNSQNRTPNLDRLAAEGIRFTDFHSNGPMCTPTRAALLTGRYQNRYGRAFESALGGTTGKNTGLPLDALTIAEVMRDAGYATGMFGKWHLGYQSPFLPTRQGFDEFRGLVSGDGDHHTHIDRTGGEDWWNGEKIEMETGYTTDLLTDHAVDFIERHQQNPFFLYLPHLAIHFPWQGPDDPPHRQAGTDYQKDKWGNIPDRGNVSTQVKAMIESLDTSTGKIIDTLQRLNLDSNTLVFFASDNGGYLNYAGGFANISDNGPLRGQKTEVYEGGHRVPAIAWWPGKIAPRVSHETVMTFDLFPTLISLVQAPDRDTLPLDGTDLSDHLFASQPLPPRTLFWRMKEAKAVRKGSWKLVIPQAKAHPTLYDLKSDIGESTDVSKEHPEIFHRLQSKLAEWEAEMPS